MLMLYDRKYKHMYEILKVKKKLKIKMKSHV